MFYDRLLEICTNKGLKITPLVKSCGGSTGSIGNWKNGATPNCDIVIKLAAHLNVSIDYLLTGKDPNTIPFPTPSSNLSQDDTEILDLFHQLPPDKQNVFKAKLEGYVECLSDITAADAEVSPNTRIGRVAAFGSPVKEIPISEENYKSAMQILSKMENEDDDDE